MKQFIKRKVTKTSKNSIRRIYLDDKHIAETGFKIGTKFSYEVDLNTRKVRIVPNATLEAKGTVSRRKNGEKLVPLIDLHNKRIEETFKGFNQCQITIFDDEIIVEPLQAASSSETTESTKSSFKFSDLCSKLISFKAKKEEKLAKIKLKEQQLNEILAKKNQKIAAGQMSLFDSNFTLSEDVVTQTLAQTSTFQNELPLLNKTLKVLSLFSGVGAFEEALKNLGIDHELVNYCEFNPMVAKAYSLVHQVPEEKNLGDVTKVDETKLPDFDLMTWGFPCQDLSSLGNQKGFFNEDGTLTRSGLFFEAIRIAKHKKPRFMIIENVRALVQKNMKENFEQMLKLLDEIGYNAYYQLLNSKDFEIPQSRTRVFIVCIRKEMDNHSFQFPEKVKLIKKAADFYDPAWEVEDECYVEEKHHKYFNEMRLKKKYSSLNSDVLVCFTTKMGHPSNPQNFIKDERGVRILTANEMFKFQGFKAEYGNLLREAGFRLKDIGYMLGNSITVNVVQKIFENLFKGAYSFNCLSAH